MRLTTFLNTLTLNLLARPRCFFEDIDERLFAKKIEVVLDGMCDALVLLFFKKQRAEAAQSQECKGRQMVEIDGEFRSLAD
jgi:glutathione S-transferase